MSHLVAGALVQNCPINEASYAGKNSAFRWEAAWGLCVTTKSMVSLLLTVIASLQMSCLFT